LKPQISQIPPIEKENHRKHRNTTENTEKICANLCNLWFFSLRSLRLCFLCVSALLLAFLASFVSLAPLYIEITTKHLNNRIATAKMLYFYGEPSERRRLKAHEEPTGCLDAKIVAQATPLYRDPIGIIEEGACLAS